MQSIFPIVITFAEGCDGVGDVTVSFESNESLALGCSDPQDGTFNENKL